MRAHDLSRLAGAWLLLLLLHCRGVAPAGDQGQDADVLLGWKAGFKYHGDGYKLLNKGPRAWVGRAPCDGAGWWGVGCSTLRGTLRVTSLNMTCAPLYYEACVEASLSPNLAQLELSLLRIYGFQIRGGIPASFASMRRLRTLALPHNGIRAPLPLPDVLPPTLEVLDLTQNYFRTGHPAPDWSLLPRLRELRLSSNSLLGKLPPASLLPQAITVLDFAFQQPRSWYDRSHKVRCPASWGSLPNLHTIILSDVQGPIPESWTRLPLGHLQLSGGFNCSLPASLARLAPTLEHLELAPPLYDYLQNLTGPVLQDWSAFHKLRVVRLHDNQLSGPLPQQLPPNIEELQLHSNNFEGTLPPGWAGATKLRYLTLQYNPLTGQIPRSWAAPGAFPAAVDPNGTYPWAGWPPTGLVLTTQFSPVGGLCGIVPPPLFGKVKAVLYSPYNTVYVRAVANLPVPCPSPCSPPPGASCTSTFFALPMSFYEGYLVGFRADDGLNRLMADTFCHPRNFTASGTIRSTALPPSLGDIVGYAWNTAPYGYPFPDCTGPTCKAFAVIECVSAGAQPLQPDARGNIGCGCSGWGNVGNWNSGNGNLGSCNQGSGNVGDGNWGNGAIGHGNHASNFYGYYDLP